MLLENTDVLSSYLRTRRVSENTKRIYRRALLSWDRYTEKPINELDKDSLLLWYDKASVELGNSTLEKYGSQIRTLYAYTLEGKGLSKRKAKAEAEDTFDIIPFKDLRQQAKRELNLRDKLVTRREFELLMKAANSPRMKALLALTYESGCRKGEIFSLRLRDVEIHDQYWSISVEGKTGTRTIPIISAVPYLKAWIQQHPDRENENSALFVTSRKGIVKPMNELSFNTGLRLLCEKVGVRMLYPHQLRHTRLTDLAENGLGDTQLRSFAGWTPGSNMASRYVHLSGSGHTNAVLETSGIEIENGKHEVKPLLEPIRCPNCDEPIDPAWVQCPHCQFILNTQLGIQRQDDLADVKAELAELKRQLLEELKGGR